MDDVEKICLQIIESVNHCIDGLKNRENLIVESVGLYNYITSCGLYYIV